MKGHWKCIGGVNSDDHAKVVERPAAAAVLCIQAATMCFQLMEGYTHIVKSCLFKAW